MKDMLYSVMVATILMGAWRFLLTRDSDSGLSEGICEENFGNG